MRYIKHISFVIIFFLIGYVTYKYFNYTKYFNSEVENLSIELTVPVLNYASQYENEDLTDSQNFKKMINWISQNYNVLEEYKEILKNGYEIKYHTASSFYLFYLYGEDKKSSDYNISISVDIDEEGLFSVKKPTFMQYLFKSTNYDIILFGYKKPDK